VTSLAERKKTRRDLIDLKAVLGDANLSKGGTLGLVLGFILVLCHRIALIVIAGEEFLDFPVDFPHLARRTVEEDIRQCNTYC